LETDFQEVSIGNCVFRTLDRVKWLMIERILFLLVWFESHLRLWTYFGWDQLPIFDSKWCKWQSKVRYALFFMKIKVILL
jgi:hypothetical protein